MFRVPFLSHRGHATTVEDREVAFGAFGEERVVEVLFAIGLAVLLVEGSLLREVELAHRTEEVICMPNI